MKKLNTIIKITKSVIALYFFNLKKIWANGNEPMCWTLNHAFFIGDNAQKITNRRTEFQKEYDELVKKYISDNYLTRDIFVFNNATKQNTENQ